MTNRFTFITLFCFEHITSFFFLSHNRLRFLKIVQFFSTRFYKQYLYYSSRSVKIPKLTSPRQSRSAGVTVTRVSAPLSSFRPMTNRSDNTTMHRLTDAFYSQDFELELHHVPKKHYIVDTRMKREKRIVPRSSRWATSSATEHQF